MPPEPDRDPLAPLPNPNRADGLSVTRWTDRARAALVLATARAAAAGRPAVSDRDLLDGLLADPLCLACAVLDRLGAAVPPPGPLPAGATGGPLPFEPEAAAAVRAACVVACQVSMVDTTHLLLALAGGRGEAAAALTAAGADPRRVRLALLPPGPPAAPEPTPAVVAGPTPTEATP